MCKKTRYRILPTLACALVFVSIAAAHEVTITDRARIGHGDVLQPGTYQVEVVKNQDSSEVLFYKGGDLQLRAPVTLEAETAKAPETEIHSEQLDDGKVITKIRLRGSKESLVFSPPSSAKAE